MQTKWKGYKQAQLWTPLAGTLLIISSRDSLSAYSSVQLFAVARERLVDTMLTDMRGSKSYRLPHLKN